MHFTYYRNSITEHKAAVGPLVLKEKENILFKFAI